MSSNSNQDQQPTTKTPPPTTSQNTSHHQYKPVDLLYQILGQIGAGGYGKVYKATPIVNSSSASPLSKSQQNKLVALKMIRVETEQEGFPITAIREVQLLRSLNKRWVVELLDIVTSASSVYLVFEYLPWDLAGICLHPSTFLSPSQVKCLMRQLLECIAYLHSQDVIHRDIKASNFLLSSQGEVKIADFGLARRIGRHFGEDSTNDCLTNRVVTIWYRPPELLLGSTSYGPEVDIWGIGCIFGELVLKKSPFSIGTCEVSQLECIFETFGPGLPTSLIEYYRLLPYGEMVKFPGDSSSGGGVRRETSANGKENQFGDSLRLVSQTLQAYRKAMSVQGWDLFLNLLELDPRRRISAQEALKHPYFCEEEPSACPNAELASILPGEWHEWETKNLRRKRWSSEMK